MILQLLVGGKDYDVAHISAGSCCGIPSELRLF